MTGQNAPQNLNKDGWVTRIFTTRILTFLVTPMIAGLILTVLAPFETHRLDLVWRATYWVSLCLAGGLGAMAVHQLMTYFKFSVRGWRHSVLQSLGSTIAVAPFVITGFENFSPTDIALTLFYIWVIAIVITAVAELAGRTAIKDEPTPDARPALMDRLPMHLRGAALYAAMSEDHYVRVHTSAGDHLVLMRLGDVSGLAQPLTGLSPHRSWWVAEQGVENVRRAHGKILIALKDGTDVPVSRTGAARVKAAGWLS